MKRGDRVMVSENSKSLCTPKGSLGYIDHEIKELRGVYNESCFYVRLDNHESCCQWESELDLIQVS
jgi:hypothetical protein